MSDELRTLQSELNNLTNLINEREKIIEVTPELSAVETLSSDNAPIAEYQDLQEIAEKVAGLQFLGKKRLEIQSILNITPERFKEILYSDEYAQSKKLILEDTRIHQLATVIEKFSRAIETLSDLMMTADEDKVRMNSAALIIQNAREMIDEEKNKLPSINGVLNEASKSGGDVTVNMAQIILNRRKERGLE